MKNSIKAISLFSNIGIGEIYLKDIGIDVVAACEIDKKRCDVYKYIFPNVKYVLNEDLKQDSTKKEICKIIKDENIELIMATPPCQGMSTAGKNIWLDERNKLVLDTIEIILKSKPKYVFIENVPTFLSTHLMFEGKKKTIESLIKERLGNFYHIDIKIVNAVDYGVPQTRKRTILLMSRCNDSEFIKIPKKTIDNPITVRMTIGKLSSIEPLIIEKSKEIDNRNYFIDHKYHYPPFHNTRHIEIMRHTPEGKSAFQNENIYKPRKKDGTIVTGFLSTYKRIKWDEPSPTITMMNGAISSQNNVHPGKKNRDGTFDNPRVLTIYEIMKLSSIPDEWSFPKYCSDNFIRSVIGEGIPPLMTKEILKEII